MFYIKTHWINSGTHIPAYIGGGMAAKDRMKVPHHPFVEQETSYQVDFPAL